MKVRDDTIERVCQHEGEEARKWLRENPQTRKRSPKRRARRSFTATA